MSENVATGPDPAVMAAIERGHAVVFFDIALDGSIPLGRIKLELFTKECPKLCENFRQFCTGEYLQSAQPVGYKGANFHRVLKNFVLQGGDFVNSDGTGDCNIYTGLHTTFTVPASEAQTGRQHDRPGLLSTAAASSNDSKKATSSELKAGCQFCITLQAADWLDKEGQHTVFGQVLDASSMLTVRKIENTPVTTAGEPRTAVQITQCGEL